MKQQVKYKVIFTKMKENNERFENLAVLLNVTVASVRNKIEGRTDWTIHEIDKLCKHFDTPYEELFKI